MSEMPIDLQILADNKCSGSDYAVYLYIKTKLMRSAQETGLSLTKLKHGYDPDDYEELYGISRSDIRDNTGYTLTQVKRTVTSLKDLELVIPDAGDNGRYYYPIHFRLPFINV